MNASSNPQSPLFPSPDLQQQVQKLDERIARIERLLRLNAPSEFSAPAPRREAPDAAPQPIPTVEPFEPIASLAAPFTALQSEIAGPSPAATAPDLPLPETQATAPTTLFSLSEWENLIGGKWALWIGSLCLFLAVASFLAYTWATLPPPPPWAKVALGMGAGAALLVAGGFFQTRTQRYFSEGLSGAGLSICDLSLWAGAQHFSILSPLTSFCGMALLTALGVFLALRTDALSLSVLSTIGGFLTPVLLQSHSASSGAVPFLFYLALLNAGILAVSLGKRWRGLVWLSFFATIFLLGGWAISADLNALRFPAFGFFSLYFLLFLGAACFYSLAREEETASPDLLLLFAATSLYAAAGFALLRPVLGAFPSVFPLALCLFLGALSALITRLAPRNLALRYSAGGLALLALTVAIPLQWNQAALTIGWVVEAGILLFLSGRLNSPLLRRAGQIVWGLTSLPLLGDLSSAATLTRSGPFSAAAFPLLMCIVVSALAAWNARNRAQNHADFDELEAYYATFSVFGGAWLLGQEIYRFFSIYQFPTAQSWPSSAFFVMSCAWGVYAWGTFFLGRKWRHETVRFGALAIAFLAAVGVVGTSLASLSMHRAPLWNERVLAFVVVGGVLTLLGRVLKGENGALSPSEKQGADAWMVATALFALLGASLELSLGLWQRQTPSTTTVFALSMLWSLAATLLLLLGCRWSQPSLRVAALGVGSGALFGLLCGALTPHAVGLPLLNWRFAAFAVVLAALSLSSRLLRTHKIKLQGWEGQLPVAFRFLALFLLLWTLTQESYELCRFAQTVLGDHWKRWGQMAISLVWSIFGAMLLIGGIHRRYQPLRLAALGLLCATVVKVFLFDLGFLSGPSRVLSLGGLGVSLLFISWLYSRFGSEKAKE